jgi:hypothetical protein
MASTKARPRGVAATKRAADDAARTPKLPSADALQKAIAIVNQAVTVERKRADRVVQSDEKYKIANIFSQRLHIQTVEQAVAFCDAFWGMQPHIAKCIKAASGNIRRTSATGKRVRPGATSIILEGAKNAN